jgi:hypothetical protein
MIIKKIAALSIISWSTVLLFSAQPKKPDYVKDGAYIMREAQTAYDSGDFSNALKDANMAKEYRKKKTEWEVFTLQNSFKPSEVKKAGDEISSILPLLEKRQDYEALDIIYRYQKNKHAAGFCTSAQKLIAYIESNKVYPEADYMIGTVYCIEGEYALAEHYLNDAWINRAVLDIPDTQYDILYSLAELSRIQSNDEKYEEYLTAVVRNDDCFKNQTLKDAVIYTIKNGKTGCADNLFRLFRITDYKSIKAYFELSKIYEKNNAEDQALYTCIICVLTDFTRMYNIIEERSPDFEYTGLESVIESTENYPDIQEWGKQNNVWETFNMLAELTQKSGYTAFSGELYRILAKCSPEQYWREKAQSVLQSYAQ